MREAGPGAHTVEMDAGATIGGRERYRIVRPLGRGGFGVTHLARRERDGRQVVVKQLRMDRLDDWKAFDLFEREAKVLEGLRHPNIPAFIDHFELKDGEALRGFALVQDWVEGRTLAELQRARPTPDAASMRRWLERLLEVCRYLHEQNPPVIHRDISPKNVIVRPDGEPVLIDFGTVQNALRSADTVASTAAGTFGYAAPEQLVGRAVPASDLYGLAMTYLAVAAGAEPETLPFSGNRVQVSAALKGHDTHPRLVLLLEELTDPDPDRRPASAQAVLDRLQTIPATGAAPSFVAASPPTKDEAPESTLEGLWRARKDRSARLGGRPWAPAPAPETEDFRTAVVDDTGTSIVGEIGFMEGKVGAFDLETYALPIFPKPSEIFNPRIAFDLDGRHVLYVSFADGVLLTRMPDGETRTRELSGLPGSMMMFANEYGAFAVSPDQKLFACLEDGVVLFDLERGTVVQRISVGARGPRLRPPLRFTPDGTALLLETFSDTLIVDPRGKTEPLENTIVAIGNDGRTVAAATEREIRIGRVERWVPFAWAGEPRHVCEIEGKVTRPRFSPDDRLLAFERSNRVTVVDVERAEIVMEVGDPYRPGAAFERVEHFGFGRDGRRLLVTGRCTVHPLATERDTAVAIYSLRRRKPLGTLRLTENKDGVHGFTTLGVHGPLSERAPRKGRKDREIGSQARALLLDGSPAEVLGDAADAALDFEERVTFWGAQVGAGRLSAEQDLAPLVEASVGLTHLLPVALDRATRQAAQAPARFGQTGADGSGPGEAAIRDALAWLAGKSEAERDVLFEDMLKQEIERARAGTDRERRKLVTRKRTGSLLVAALVLALAAVAGVVALL